MTNTKDNEIAKKNFESIIASEKNSSINSRKKQKIEEVYISFEDKSYFDKIKDIEEKLKNFIIDNYDVDNEMISKKYIHTFKTKLVSDQIVTSLNLNDREKYLASIIALFHDYARFEQAKIYNSFNDLTTVDHADLAVEMLFEKNQIINFINDLTEEELLIVKLAIKNHNKFSIEDNLLDKQNMFCKIVRDADKVDIYRVISTDFGAKNVPQGKLLQEDLNNFYNHKLYKHKKESTFYTFVLTSLSFIYDINYKKSYELILKNDYINKYMYAILLATPFKIDEALMECFKYAKNFVKEKTKTL